MNSVNRTVEERRRQTLRETGKARQLSLNSAKIQPPLKRSFRKRPENIHVKPCHVCVTLKCFAVLFFLLSCCVNTLVSLRNRKAGRRGRQNACVWQTWQGYYVGLLSWSSFNINVSRLLQNDLFKERCSLATCFFKQNYCHDCHTRFAVFFSLPSCCVSSLLLTREARSRKARSSGARVAMGKRKEGRICLSLSFFRSPFALLLVTLLAFRSSRAILAS